MVDSHPDHYALHRKVAPRLQVRPTCHRAEETEIEEGGPEADHRRHGVPGP